VAGIDRNQWPLSSGIGGRLRPEYPAKDNIGGYKKEWRKFSSLRWSKLNCQEYEELIGKLRNCFGINAGFWQVESHWQGYR
jgi:hypothetical protein